MLATIPDLFDGVEIRTVSGPVINEINVTCPKKIYSISVFTVWEVAIVIEEDGRDERECHRGTVEHLNCHQRRLVVNDNHGQWLPRP